MTQDAYEETLAEVAGDFQLDPEQLRAKFRNWLLSSNTDSDPMCYAIYRIVKLKGACRMSMRSRNLWAERATEAGWSPTGRTAKDDFRRIANALGGINLDRLPPEAVPSVQNAYDTAIDAMIRKP